VTDDGWLETPERGLHELPIGTGEYLAASGFHSIAESSLAELGRMAGLYAAGSGPNTNAPDLPIDQARGSKLQASTRCSVSTVRA
jgi:hypothetical protein